jgi:predicted GNAT superfamily acetyltransferase
MVFSHLFAAVGLAVAAVMAGEGMRFVQYIVENPQALLYVLVCCRLAEVLSDPCAHTTRQLHGALGYVTVLAYVRCGREPHCLAPPLLTRTHVP